MSYSSGSSPLRKVGVALGLVAICAIIAAIFVRPTSISTGPDEVGLHYSGGAFTPTRFKNCVGNSTREWDGPGDKHYRYPDSQTNFVFGPGGDGPAITFVTKDGIEMTVTGVANLMLNTQCEALTQFHDLIGNRYKAYLDDDGNRPEGWTLKVLPIYIGKPLDTAIDRAGQAFTYTELYTDPNKKAEWEQDVLDALPDLVNRQTDGDVDFFENYALTLQKPEPPQEIKTALVEQQAAVARAKAKEAEAGAAELAAIAEVKVQKAEADKIAAIIQVLGKDGYLKKYAIDKGQNPFQPQTNGIIQNAQPN
jgi:regulator of protease activity HflC (stomatin/prohibitin superfamily)